MWSSRTCTLTLGVLEKASTDSCARQDLKYLYSSREPFEYSNFYSRQGKLYWTSFCCTHTRRLATFWLFYFVVLNLKDRTFIILSIILYRAWGEALFLAIQTSTIGFMCLVFSGKQTSALGFLGVYAGIMWFLLSGMTPMNVLASLQASNIFLVVSSKVNKENVAFFRYFISKGKCPKTCSSASHYQRLDFL